MFKLQPIRAYQAVTFLKKSTSKIKKTDKNTLTVPLTHKILHIFILLESIRQKGTWIL